MLGVAESFFFQIKGTFVFSDESQPEPSLFEPKTQCYSWRQKPSVIVGDKKETRQLVAYLKLTGGWDNVPTFRLFRCISISSCHSVTHSLTHSVSHYLTFSLSHMSKPFKSCKPDDFLDFVYFIDFLDILDFLDFLNFIKLFSLSRLSRLPK